MSASARKYVYSIAAALSAVLILYGVITADVAPLWLALVASLLSAAGNLTAIRNTTSVGRASLYGVGLAVVGLLIGYRVLDASAAPVWLALLSAVLGVGTNALAVTHLTPDVKGDEVFPEGEPLDAEEDYGVDESEGMAR